MGLLTIIERRDMSAAIGMATEGIRTKYNVESGAGGYRSADTDIGLKVYRAKVLCVVERMSNKAQHLADWCMFAYASPFWNAKENKARLVDAVLNDWVLNQLNSGLAVQPKTIERIRSLIPVIAGGLALEQASGSETTAFNGDMHDKPSLTRTYLISVLVSVDCIESNDQSEQFKNTRRRHYQTHWGSWVQHIDEIRALLTKYDVAARELFRKEFELRK